jgi:hypothetical protein
MMGLPPPPFQDRRVMLNTVRPIRALDSVAAKDGDKMFKYVQIARL